MSSGVKQFVGDINNDGRIDNIDALICLKAVVGDIVLDDDETLRADVNGDGEVTIVDARAILKHVSGETLIDEVIE